ncbi:hypothetical protein [Xanthobacter flavus]|uniref:hypothetical protein n=1 Tax=Xanthobacter flavus TaxID=281 RepID=UPI00372B1F05
MGRKKEFPVRITLPLAEGVTERMDALVSGDETRLDLIRDAIERELRRREEARPGTQTKPPSGKGG